MSHSRLKVFASALILLMALGACNQLPEWMGGKKPEIVRLPGQREAVIPAGADMKADEELKKTPVTLPSPTPNDSWSQHTGNFTAATANLASAATFDKQDSVSIGDGEEYVHTLVARPVVGAGLVFAMDAEGYISAHEAGNISNVKWHSQGVYEDVDQDNIGGGLAFDQGKLYATSGRGLIAAFDATTGKELWHTSVNIPFRSAPKVAEDKVFAVTIDDQIFAIEAASGKVLWNQRGIGESAGLLNAVSPTTVSGAVIVPYSSGEIYMLTSDDGRELWNDAVVSTKRASAGDVFTGIGGDPVVDGQVVFAVSNGGGFSVLSVDQGQHVWDKPLASVNTPWIAGDYVFLLTTDNTLMCFMKYDGRVRWATKLESFRDPGRNLLPITWRGPVMVAGKLAVVSSHGQLVLVSATDGVISQTKEIPNDIETAPVVAGGVIYLVGKNAELYSLQ